MVSVEVIHQPISMSIILTKKMLALQETQHK